MTALNPYSQTWRWDVSRAMTGVLSTPGIAFPATQVPSADPNTLDDYEEGTYTPVIVSGTGTITTASATGSYIKIGRVVHVFVNISITTNGTGASTVTATLPFTSVTGNVAVIPGRENNVNGNMLAGIVGSGANLMVIVTYNNQYPGANGVLLCMAGIYQAVN